MKRTDRNVKDSKDLNAISSSSHSSSSFSIFFRGKAEKDSSNDEAGGSTYDYEEDNGVHMGINGGGLNTHVGSNTNGSQQLSTLKRYVYIQYGKLKRNFLWRFSIRGMILFVLLVYVVTVIKIGRAHV